MRSLSIQISQQETEWVLAVTWEDTWTMLCEIVTENDAIENDYIDLVEKLKAIDEKVKAQSIDEAKKLFTEFEAKCKEIETKYTQKVEGGEPDLSHMINGGKESKLEDHTCEDLVKNGFEDILKEICKRDGWTDGETDSYIMSIKNGLKKTDEVKLGTPV